MWCEPWAGSKPHEQTPAPSSTQMESPMSYPTGTDFRPVIGAGDQLQRVTLTENYQPGKWQRRIKKKRERNKIKLNAQCSV